MIKKNKKGIYKTKSFIYAKDNILGVRYGSR